MQTLDRSKPFNRVAGNSPAKYFQAGKYFTGNGVEIAPEQAAKPKSLTAFELKEINKARAEKDLPPATRSELIADETPEVPQTAEPPKAESAQAAERTEAEATKESVKDVDTSFEERKAMAMELHHKALAKMVEDVYKGLESKEGVPEVPFSGDNSKERNAEWLAEYGPR